MTHAVEAPGGIDIARTSRDIRVISAALAVNSAVIKPATITATGREAVSQHAIVPGSFPASFALLPHIDYVDDPAVRPGCGFVGGRQSSIVPDLAPAAIPAPVDLRVELKQLPASRDQVRRRLRETSGLWWAPGALFALVGWEDDWVAVLADHLRENGPAAMLTVALAQAQYAHRKMWLRVGHNVGAPPANLAAWWPSLSTQAGTVATGRALIDVAAVLIAMVNETVAAGESIASVSRVMQKVKVLLGHFVHYAVKAERRPDAKARGMLMKAAKAARTLLDAVAIFSVAPEALGKRWQRLDAELAGVAITTDPGTLRLADLVAFETGLNRLGAANLGSRLEGTTWRNHTRRSLLRLARPRLADRIALLHRVRADLLYKLAMTGRFERLYELFPWLAAPHGAFVGCAGGALGALASLIEAGRRLAIGREQLHELVEALDDDGVERHRAAVRRLTVPAAATFSQSQVRMAAAAGHGFVAGMALDNGAFSHATVTAVMNGAHFGPDYPLTVARFGTLGWRLPVALQNPRTSRRSRRSNRAGRCRGRGTTTTTSRGATA